MVSETQGLCLHVLMCGPSRYSGRSEGVIPGLVTGRILFAPPGVVRGQVESVFHAISRPTSENRTRKMRPRQF
jgi:hypothetical protein